MTWVSFTEHQDYLTIPRNHLQNFTKPSSRCTITISTGDVFRITRIMLNRILEYWTILVGAAQNDVEQVFKTATWHSQTVLLHPNKVIKWRLPPKVLKISATLAIQPSPSPDCHPTENKWNHSVPRVSGPRRYQKVNNLPDDIIDFPSIFLPDCVYLIYIFIFFHTDRETCLYNF